MFDNNVRNVNRNSYTFNSVAGTLVKSCDDSKFVRFHMDSNLSDGFFDLKSPHYKDAYGIPVPIKVLQVMLCGDEQYLVEYLEVGV